jgi:hypothetical protein
VFYILLFSVAFGITDGIKEGYKLEHVQYERWHQFDKADKYNRAWHKWQFASNVSGVALGFTIALDSNGDWLRTGLRTLLAGALFYNIREVSMNLTRDRGAFAKSTHNFSGLRELDFLRLPVLIIAVLINLIY